MINSFAPSMYFGCMLYLTFPTSTSRDVLLAGITCYLVRVSRVYLHRGTTCYSSAQALCW